jgi:hypothetical protein
LQTEDIILKQFPKTAMIPLVTAGNCIGLAEQTCYNMAHKKIFPMPVRKVGRKSMVALTDLIRYLDAGPTAFKEESEKQNDLPKRRPGRPTKAEQVRRMRGEI